MTYRRLTGIKSGLVLFSGVLFSAGSLFMPAAAYAGALGQIFGIFGTLSAEAGGNPEVHRSSAVPALRAAVNLDPNPAKGGGDIIVVDGVGGLALASEEGPEGTSADVVDKQSSGQISVYVVHAGDTLSQIANMFGVSVNTIRWANDLSAGAKLRTGQTLVILPITGVKHTVAKGETVKSIVKKYDGDLEEVLQYNGLAEGAALAVGDVLVIPHGEIAAPAPTKTSSPTRIVAGSGGPELIGYFLRPILGGRKSQGIHGYNGVDIAAPVGTPVLASADGTVIIARASGWNGGYGNYIVVSHSNGTQTLYAHLSSVSVGAGQSVGQGQSIGTVGNTGRSTGSHLHFEVRGAKNPF